MPAPLINGQAYAWSQITFNILGGENFFFYWDGLSTDRKIFWPAEKVSGGLLLSEL